MAKILMHTLVFPPDANSNAYIFADLAKELRTLGHEITVLTTTPHYAFEESSLERQPLLPERGHWLMRSSYEGIPCYHIAVPPRKGGIRSRIRAALAFHFFGLWTALSSDFRCDIVLSQSPPLSIGLLSAWIARRHRGRSIYVAQDIFPDGLINQGRIRNPVIILLIRILERQVYRRSDAVCSISDGLVEVLKPRVPEKTLLRTIPNFVNTKLYHVLPRTNSFSAEHALDHQFVVSYVGNLGNAQDFEPLLSAAEVCRDTSIRFLLVGSGIKQKSLAAEVLTRHLTNVTLMGYQSREKTPLINATSDLCLVLMSSHVRNFSFPSKIYTLMACGKPILLYGHPDADAAKFVRENGIGWVVRNGDVNGFADMVMHLYHNRCELEDCGRRALALVQQHYTVEAVARQYDDLIHTLLQKR